ncbi:MAG: transposase [Aureispira sp.]
MAYNPKIHNRRSIRLKGYDYSQAGLYFVTLCCQGRVSFFGKIEGGHMQLNDAGQMIEKWYWILEQKFPDIRCRAMIIMPNHFHCILENIGSVGTEKPIIGAEKPIIGADTLVRPNNGLPCVIQWFKTMTTNEYIRGVKTLGWKRFDRRLWQRNYWEHIIRNQIAYQNITNYIINNPQKWSEDQLRQKK